MKVACVGGGPAGLYAAILLKRGDPSREITVWERNRPDDTFGFGVVFSDQTLGKFQGADPESYATIASSFVHWDDIDIHYRGQVLTSTGHGFAGMGRVRLLTILQDRARELGVVLRFEEEIQDLAAMQDADLVVCADGVNSRFREAYKAHFKPQVDWRSNRFSWMGTPADFQAFKFFFRESEHGLFRVHAYRYAPGRSTFIVETTEDTWRRAGLDQRDEQATAAYFQSLFEAELGGAPLLVNRSIWRQFPTIRCERWYHGNVALMGDAVHTAHFSIGSGTKIAMEDAIELATQVDRQPSIPEALAAWEKQRKADVVSVQRAAQVSLEWFENVERYYGRLEPRQFAFSLLTRSLRVSHENLRLRDPAFVGEIDRGFAEASARQAGLPAPTKVPPPMFTPYRLGRLLLPNRVVVSPMSTYSAVEGVPTDFHLVHLGARAQGGAGLLMAEMTNVSPEGRITPGCAGLWTDEQGEAWRRIVGFVHTHTGAKIGIQLGHAGRKGACRLPWEAGSDTAPLDTPWELLAPSASPWAPGSPTPRAMTRADMDRVGGAYVEAARRAAEAGFDVLELHYAHGYLMSSFLSPLTNLRTDAYGGELPGRLRFPLEVWDAVRAVWPADRPMLVRISATDWAPGGNTGETAVEIARAFHTHGADAVDVSAGQVVPHQRPVYGRLFQTPFAERIRLEAGVPTVAVGAISSWEDVNSILAAGRADLCALARAQLADPYWTRHAAEAQGWDGLPWTGPYETLQTFRPKVR